MMVPRRIGPLVRGILFSVALLASLPPAGADTLDDERRFSVVDLAEQPVDLAALLATHRAVLVNFWASWCALCKEEIPALARLHERSGEEGIAIIGVNVGESARKVQAYAERLGINYPVVLDPDSELAEAWNVVGLPLSMLVHADGTLSGPYSGYTQQMQDDIAAVLE
ncbi:MAG: TlpA disulfide reductase family protein [Gammaproteobacteria bacterium]